MTMPADPAALTLPAGVHGTALTARDIVTGEMLREVVLWHDRVTGTCDRCHQPIPREVDCPVMLDTGAGQGGQLQEWPQQHGCGEWLPVDWRELGADPSETDILAAAGELHTAAMSELDIARDLIRRRLADELRDALTHLAAGGDPDDITSGDETTPGVWRPVSGGWEAWDYDPATTTGEAITVTAADMEAHQ